MLLKLHLSHETAILLLGHRVEPHELGLLSSRVPEEYKAFMVAYFKTPSHVRVRKTRATRKKQESYYDRNDYNPYSMYSTFIISFLNFKMNIFV